MAAAFPQLEQAAALEVALAFADPGLLLAQLAHEQMQLSLHDVHLALGQLLLAPPKLLFLEALLLRCPQQLLLTAPELLGRRRGALGRGPELPCPWGWSQGCWAWLVSRTGRPAVGQIGAQSNLGFTTRGWGRGQEAVLAQRKGWLFFLLFFLFLFDF